MRQSIRALGWATKILWIATMVFMVTSLYSPLKLILERQIEIGSPQTSFSNGTIAVSLPFFINNTGFYDISDLNVTTSVADYNGTLVSTSTTFVQNIPRGGSVNETHRMTTNLDEIISKNLTYLLFNDTTFNLNASVGLKIAHVIPLQVSIAMNMSWEAPLYNFSIKEKSHSPYNTTHSKVVVLLSFNNTSPYDWDDWTIIFELYNNEGCMGSGNTTVNVSPGYHQWEVEMLVKGDPREIKRTHVYFRTLTVTFGPVVRKWKGG